MNDEQFVKTMEVIRKNSDKIFTFEGDRTPVLIVYAKEHNDNVEKLVEDVGKYLAGRVDIVLLEDYDEIKIGEYSPKDNEIDGRAAKLEL